MPTKPPSDAEKTGTDGATNGKLRTTIEAMYPPEPPKSGAEVSRIVFQRCGELGVALWLGWQYVDAWFDAVEKRLDALVAGILFL